MLDIIQSLHPLERKLFPYIKNNISFEDLTNDSKLQEVEVMRALQWL